jgi:hypothetical protein
MVEGREPAWDDVVCASANQLSSPIGEDLAVLALDEGAYYGLNPTGNRIWELLQKPTRVAEIYTALVDEFEVDAEVARRDLLALLAELHAAGLIEVLGEGTA